MSNQASYQTTAGAAPYNVGGFVNPPQYNQQNPPQGQFYPMSYPQQQPYPPNAVHPGQPPQYPQGQYPQGQYPQGQYPQGQGQEKQGCGGECARMCCCCVAGYCICEALCGLFECLFSMCF